MRNHLRLGRCLVAALVFASLPAALAQGLPKSQPKLLTIVREEVKVGRAAEHARHEAGWPAAYEKAKSPDYYLALSSITGSPATVTSWVSGATALTGNSCSGAAVHPACVVAVRIGVVARSSQSAKETVDQPNPLTVLPQIGSGSPPAGAAVTYTLPDTSMRYRAYSTIIPLKNVIWGR